MSLIPVYSGPALPGSGDIQADAGKTWVSVEGFKGASVLRSQQYTASEIAGRALGKNPNRRTVTIQNLGANAVYVGGPEVTTATGLQIATTTKLTIECQGEVYLITAAGGSEDCRLLEEIDA